jgi:SEC-C motif
MRTGRNDPCPCGSGKKFKNCCEGKARGATPKGLIAIIVVLVAIAAVAFIPRGDEKQSTALRPAAAAAPANRPGPQPPGPVPPGKVWSAEHGHWHDANAQPPVNPIEIKQTSGPLKPTATANVPQPAGPVPPGKVWSPEHGHWHDLPAGR